MDGRTLFSGVGKGYSPRCTYSVGGEPFIIQGKAGDGEAPMTSFSTVSARSLGIFLRRSLIK